MHSREFRIKTFPSQFLHKLSEFIKNPLGYPKAHTSVQTGIIEKSEVSLIKSLIRDQTVVLLGKTKERYMENSKETMTIIFLV